MCEFEAAEEINRFIPEELVENILLRLPADFLRICKRVCKPWFDLINDPSFVNKHMRFTIENSKVSSSRTIFLKWIRQELSLEDIFNPDFRPEWHEDDPSKLELSLVTFCKDDGGNEDYIPCVIEQINLPPLPAPESFPTSFRVFHCNGIIHMLDTISSCTSVLLNPALLEFKLLREPHIPFTSNYANLMGCGFGYDLKANLYKCVKIFGNDYGKRPVALVHTLGTKLWRKIKIVLERGNYWHLHPRAIYCKGAYYWPNMSGMGHMLLSFDMSEEKFRSIPFPNQLLKRTTDYSLHLLHEWNDSVVLLFSSHARSWNSTVFEMWVMVDGYGTGVEGSTYWIKHLEIGPLPCLHFPLAFWKCDELLLETRDGRVVSYNLFTRKIRNVRLPGAVFPGFTLATSCLNTLVSV